MQGDTLLQSVKEEVLRTFPFVRAEDEWNQTPHFLHADHVAFLKVNLNRSGSEIIRHEHRKETSHISTKALVLLQLH